MNVTIGNRSVRLSPSNLLGQGGEARVYRWRGKAVKVYHSTLPRELLRKRVAKLKDWPSGLPDAVLGPLDLVRNGSRQVVGFVMPAVEDGEDFRRLSLRQWREGVLSNDDVTALFRRFHALLVQLHDRGVVVGDLNDCNVLFTGTEPWLIDADSMQFGSHRCVVAHEKFLAPHLYGIDLTTTTAFDPLTDWYAFNVLLFSSLLYVHPYGGIHRDHPTLLRRAEARHSVLRPDVTRPRVAGRPEILPDGLLRWFTAVFDQGLSDVFPARLLDIQWTRCPCGSEHARAACPECASRGVVARRPLRRRKGRCEAVTIRRTLGRILAAHAGPTLTYLYEEDGVVHRQDGSRVPDDRVPAETHAMVAGTVTTQDAWLVSNGRRLGSILPDQTWFRMGPRFGYGHYRAGNVSVHFLFRPDRPGLVRLDLPSLRGRLLDVDAVFDDHHVLVSWQTQAGTETDAAVFLVRDDGSTVARAIGKPADSPLLANVGAKAVTGGRVLVATDEGLLSVAVDEATRTLVRSTLFEDTAQFVTDDVRILPGTGGSVYVVHPREILHLSLL